MAVADGDTCSASSAAIGESLVGTAPLAMSWLAIEQAGPFGHDALRQSHFPRDVAEELLRRLEGTGIRPALIRRVGKHADTHSVTAPRHVYLASSRTGATGLAGATVEDPRALLDIDLSALAAGDVGAAWTAASEIDDPLLLVCTHAKRDQCCAIHGRPLAKALASEPEMANLVWETSHLGGHRFSPTAVQLPHGWVHGRLDARTAFAVLSAAKRDDPTVPMENARGRSSLSSVEQAADIAVRKARGVFGIDDTRVLNVGPDLYEVNARDRGTFKVSVTSVDLAAPRRESCLKSPVLGTVFKTAVL